MFSVSFSNNKKNLEEKNKYIESKYMEIKTPNWFNSSSLSHVDISVVVPCYKSKNQIIQQINSWHKNESKLNIEIIYIDDCCPEKTHAQCIKSWEEIKHKLKRPVGKCFMVLGRNHGFANACNIGAKEAKGKYVLFLNADIKVTSNWIDPLYNLLNKNSEIGIVGNVQLSENGLIDSCGSEWSWKEHIFYHVGKDIFNGKKITPYEYNKAPDDIKKSKEIKMLNGSCIMISKNLFHEIEGFDTRYKLGYWEDSDLCMKVAMKGYKLFFCSESIVYHEGGHSGFTNHKFYNENRNLFYSKWIRTKLLHCHLEDTKKNNIKAEECVVYTAITNNYDTLKSHNFKNVEFVAFTDEEKQNKFWGIEKVNDQFNDANRNAKKHKILSHIYFPNKKYSLWIDGSIKIKFKFDLISFFESFLQDCDMMVFKHAERNCLYDEAKICCEMNLDVSQIIEKQMLKYKKEKIKTNLGLSECSVILRKHNEKVINFNEIWWKEICDGSKRDQLSFDYAVRKSKVNCKYFPGYLPYNNFLFDRLPHGVIEEKSEAETNLEKESYLDLFFSFFEGIPCP